MQDCKLNILSTIPDNNSCSHAFVGAVLLTNSSKQNGSFLIEAETEIQNKLIKIITRFYPDLEIDCWDNFLLIKGNIYEFLNGINFDTVSISAYGTSKAFPTSLTAALAAIVPNVTICAT